MQRGRLILATAVALVATATVADAQTTSTTSTTSTTTSTTTTTTTTSTVPLPRGPGNGPASPRPEAGLAPGVGVDATAVRGRERVDLVVSRGSPLTVQVTTWTGSAWTEYADLGAPPGGYVGAPTITSWAPGRLDVFVRGGDNKLWQRFTTGGPWSPWAKPVGDDGVLASSPAVSTRGPGLLDVWVVGTDDHVYQRWWDGTRWNGWLDQGHPEVGIFDGSRPTAVSRDGVHVDVFVRSTDSKLWQRTWTGSAWTAWAQPPGSNSGTLNTSPDATAWDADNLLVFVIGTDQHPYALPFGSGGWGPWTRLVGPFALFTASPGATSRGVNRFDMFAPGTDNRVYQVWQ